jgi:hypothetical protein
MELWGFHNPWLSVVLLNVDLNMWLKLKRQLIHSTRIIYCTNLGWLRHCNLDRTIDIIRNVQIYIRNLLSLTLSLSLSRIWTQITLQHTMICVIAHLVPQQQLGPCESRALRTQLDSTQAFSDLEPTQR